MPSPSFLEARLNGEGPRLRQAFARRSVRVEQEAMVVDWAVASLSGSLKER
jgi:hypothetical protein